MKGHSPNTDVPMLVACTAALHTLPYTSQSASTMSILEWG